MIFNNSTNCDLIELDKPGLYPWCQKHKWIYTFNFNNNNYRIECSKSINNHNLYLGVIYNGVNFNDQEPIQRLYIDLTHSNNY